MSGLLFLLFLLYLLYLLYLLLYLYLIPKSTNEKIQNP